MLPVKLAAMMVMTLLAAAFIVPGSTAAGLRAAASLQPRKLARRLTTIKLTVRVKRNKLTLMRWGCLLSLWEGGHKVSRCCATLLNAELRVATRRHSGCLHRPAVQRI